MTRRLLRNLGKLRLDQETAQKPKQNQRFDKPRKIYVLSGSLVRNLSKINVLTRRLPRNLSKINILTGRLLKKVR